MAILDEQSGEIAALKQTIYDLTQVLHQKEQRCEQLKHELEEKKWYLALLENMPLSVWVADIDGYIEYYNQSGLNYLGLTLAEVKGKNWINSIHPDDINNTLTAWSAAILNQRPYEAEYRLKGKNGDFRWQLAKANPVFNSQGLIIKWIGARTDINDAKLAQAAEQETRERLHLAMESAQIGSWDWDMITDAVRWDEHIPKLFGLTEVPPQWHFPNVLNMLHLDDRARVGQQIEKVIQEKSNLDIEFRVIWPDGSTHWLYSRGKLFFNEQQKPIRFIGVCCDINERKKNELWKQSHQLELAEVTKLSSIRELSSRLAHELNQPLAAITLYLEGCVERLQTKTALQEDLLFPLTKAAEQARRAGAIIHRIKDFMQQAKVHKEVTNLNELIRESANFMQHEMTDYKFTIKYKLQSDLCSIFLDKIQIQQVIINLLRNSIEAMLDAKIVDPTIVIESYRETDKVVIAIEDNGPGIMSDAVENLFSSYYTTKPYGMGLGLAICQSIIEAHSGNLTCLTNQQAGAKFVFTLPCYNCC